MRHHLLSSILLTCSTLTGASDTYVPPPASLSAVAGVQFAGEPIGKKFRTRFNECDTANTCDSQILKRGCSKDRNHNSALLKLKNSVIFFDAKSGLDADGSPYSKYMPGQTDQPQTSLRYLLPGKPSINADRVPFIVIPQGGFGKELGVQLGDVVAVVYGDKRIFALVADVGPICKIGEGSIELHESLGHGVCKNRNPAGDCISLWNTSIDRNVLYFIFPGTASALLPGLTPENIRTRVNEIGTSAWKELAGQ
jgi:hypothetical protein